MRKQHKLVQTGIFLVVISSVGCNDALRPTPSANAILRVNRECVGGNASHFMIYKETQAALMRSIFVLTKALQNQELANINGVSLASIHGALKVQAGEDEILGVSLSSSEWTKEEMERLLDGVINAYLAEVIHQERTELVGHLAALQETYDPIVNDLQAKSEQVARLKKELGRGKSVAIESRIHALHAKLIELQLQLVDEQSNDNEKQVAVTQTKTEFLEKEIEVQTKRLAELKAKTDQLIATEQAVVSKRELIEKLDQEIPRLKAEIESPNKIEVLQAAVIPR